MNTNDLLLRWSNLSLDQIEDEIREGKDQDSAVELLGAGTVAEMQAVSFAPPSAAPKEAVVLLPGIMGSLLTSIRGVTTLVWINPLMFVQGNARYLRMDGSGVIDECHEVEIVPVGLEKMTYLKMELTLNREAQLYEFPYDWRRNIEYNADKLHESLERWAGGTKRKFTLLAHSMGGLVSRTYMARHTKDAEQRVKKLVMMGTPNYGSTNAIETLMTGNSLMETVDKLSKNNAMIDVVRSMPGVYNLLPAPPECFPSARAYPMNWDLYTAATWNIPGIQQKHLDSTRSLYQALGGSDPQIPMVEIAGCNLDTLVGMDASLPAASAVSTAVAAAKLVLKPNRVEHGDDSGDGTVPLWSARLPGADLFYIEEKHADLPKNQHVIQAALELINDGKPGLATALPEPKGGLFGLSFDVPGEGAAPAAVTLSAAELEARIRSGTANQDDLKQLYFAL
jgi:pimeloyl-ACP methyl ester carboxylesterase